MIQQYQKPTIEENNANYKLPVEEPPEEPSMEVVEVKVAPANKGQGRGNGREVSKPEELFMEAAEAAHVVPDIVSNSE